MWLIAELERSASLEASPFRAQLLREDAIRLRKLHELAGTSPSPETYRRAGRRLGWTAQDARTGELGDALERLLDAVYLARVSGDDEGAQADVRDAWVELTRVRMERLVGCLSTPVPKPAE